MRRAFAAVIVVASLAGCGLDRSAPVGEIRTCVSQDEAKVQTLAELRRIAPAGLQDGTYQIPSEWLDTIGTDDLRSIEVDEYPEGRIARSYSFDLLHGEVTWRITASYDNRCELSLFWARLGK